MTTNKRNWIVIHEHRHGESNYHVRCDHVPSEDEVIEFCQIDFEPNREFLTISELFESEIIDIP
jgi:hypothetical protein